MKLTFISLFILISLMWFLKCASSEHTIVKGEGIEFNNIHTDTVSSIHIDTLHAIITKEPIKDN
jgi:hypothetical protein